MASYDSVKAFSHKVVTELPRLDALLANAGISTNQYARAEGLEQTLTVNVVATFLLAQLCLPALERTAKADGKPTHLTIVGSNVHAFADPGSITSLPEGKVFSTLSEEETADMAGRYYLSKLLVQLGVQELATRIPKIDQSSGSPSVMGRGMLRLIGRTGEEGARVLVAAITAGPESHGKFFSESQVKNASVWVRSAEGKKTQKSVWAELEGILGGIVRQ
jgi:retinol dehydrogenase-12